MITEEEARRIYEEADDNMRKILDAMRRMSKEQLQELIKVLDENDDEITQGYIIVTDSEGKVIHYAENFYFTVAKTLYSVNYACMDGVGYDETFSFSNYVAESFTFKG